MPAESPRRSKLTQLVSHHVFRHEHFYVELAVVNHEGVADELRHDRAGTCPGLDGLLATRLGHPFHFQEQLRIYERAFFERSSHRFSACQFAANVPRTIWYST